ncbi:MAG: NmrA family protein [Hymenobacter sp.]|nr:NmrA family protein [Hymenobacter sp.]
MATPIVIVGGTGNLGGRIINVDAQATLLAAAIAAGVPRFIPSDFASDYTKTREGDNCNFDLRREFNHHLDQQAGIAGTSILNGAFAEVLAYNPQLLNRQQHRVGYVEDTDWQVDFTTMDDTAAYTAAAALDHTTPRYLRIASFQLSPRELAKVAGEVAGVPYTLNDLGSRDALAAFNRRERAAHPEGEQEIYPRWQQSQYLHSMFSVQNTPLDNARYPELRWTGVRDVLAAN